MAVILLKFRLERGLSYCGRVDLYCVCGIQYICRLIFCRRTVAIGHYQIETSRKVTRSFIRDRNFNEIVILCIVISSTVKDRSHSVRSQTLFVDRFFLGGYCVCCWIIHKMIPQKGPDKSQQLQQTS